MIERYRFEGPAKESGRIDGGGCLQVDRFLARIVLFIEPGLPSPTGAI
ncbi:MAG: hypothetical protein ABSH41_18805 [Syntrophobacteraceae bacterium]